MTSDMEKIEIVCNITATSLALIIQIYHIIIFFIHKTHIDKKVNNILIISESNRNING